jgi:hypothetical protein
MLMKANSKHPLYRKWRNIISRCYKPYNNNFEQYGGRGVIVDERWHDFCNFVEDVDTRLENGYLLYEQGYDLDKDLKGGNIYSLENCVVMPSEINRRMGRQKQKKPVFAISNEETIRFGSVSDCSQVLKINRGSIQQYLKKGKVHSSGYYFQYL